MAEPVVAVLDSPPLEWLFQHSSWPIWALWGAAFLVFVFGFALQSRTKRIVRFNPSIVLGLVAIILVLVDGLTFKFLLLHTTAYWQICAIRFVPALLFFFVLWRAFLGKKIDLALRKPLQPKSWWLTCAALILLLAALGTISVYVAVQHFGHQRAVLETALWQDLLYGVLLSPLVEELIYRENLCLPLEKKIGQWPTVLLSGCLFAALHAIYGNLAYTNFLAGFFLAWCFLKSRSFWLAVAFHGLINLCVTLHGMVLKSIFLS